MTYVGKKPADIIATAVDTTTGTFSGDLTVDTNTLYVDSANNRVGIRTSSPEANLHLKQSGADKNGIKIERTDSTAEYLLLSNHNGASRIYGVDENGVGRSTLQFGGSEDGSTFNEHMRINSSGNVGIGTSSPASDAGLSKILQLGSSSDTSVTFVLKDDDGDFEIGSAGGSLRIYDDGTERMRIDSSGNLLLGKTSAGLSNVGFQVLPTGVVGITRSGSNPLDLNRLSSDGNLIEFNKDGTTVGGIGVTGSDQFYIARTTGNHGIKFKNSATMPSSSAGADADNAQDLGSSSVRWKDLYLSGGVYIGGTGSANYLDDYEEGAWTPDFLNDGATTYDHQVGRYVKIGQLVMAWFHIDVNSNSIGTNALRVGNLPFTGLNVNNEASYGAVSALHCNNWSTTNKPDNGLVPSSSTYADLYKSQGTTGTSQLNGNDIGGGNLIGCIIYRAA